MDLSGLFPLLRDSPAYQGLASNPGGQKLAVLDAVKPFMLACLHRDLRIPMLMVSPTPEGARRTHQELTAWCQPTVNVILFPEIDVLPYEPLSADPAVVRERLGVLALLSEYRRSPDSPVLPPLVVASATALAQKTIPAGAFAAACWVVKKRIHVDLNHLLAAWLAIGYTMEDLVEAPGSMSRRGGIVDVYSPNSDLPSRIELLGPEVESIRHFDPATQCSVMPVDSTTVVPARELLLPGQEKIERALKGLNLADCSATAGRRIARDLDLLAGGQWIDGVEFYAPLFNDGALMDYFPDRSLVVLDLPGNIDAQLAALEAQAASLREAQVGKGDLPSNFPRPCFDGIELKDRIGQMRSSLILESWGDESAVRLMPFGPPPSYAGGLSHFLEEARDWIQSGGRIVVVSQETARISELLADRGVLAVPQADLGELPAPRSLTIVRGSLAGGWANEGTLLVGDTELFGFPRKPRPAARRRAAHQSPPPDLNIGDHVVHVDHGIARFAGTLRMAPEGVERDYLVLDYAEGDKLYVPTDQIDRVSRYVGVSGHMPSLSRLGTQEWSRAKARVKKAAGELAQELLEVHASRELSPGFAFSPDTIWQQELEASFPYAETPDQVETLKDVKHDMEAQKPMDRLVCGDVGYGKTEVAVRAAFKAAMDDMQVAVLVPTTVLAQQHLHTFAERLKAFPFRVEMLSRFRSAAEQKEVLAGLHSGAVDVCIGTHRLLQKDVIFKNLGLVIIDEEQKFGVAHKERLKQLRREVDVLTLTATPIPRTLHLSLVGIRDMSTIRTPPEERLPIKTCVAEYDERLVREAVLRELDRNGQVFFAHNRVQTIAGVAERLGALVPEARIAIAHGQMPEDRLESTMLDFSAGMIDVLVCTTIIESGLDLPNANTLLVNQADKLGLTQLYHLRGRVGRGGVRSYAYFFYDKGRDLAVPARMRLKTIFEATELGAGFRIAMKDLEIRGAGNILGPRQSGHIGVVGFDLYCRLLADAVEELRAAREQRAPRRSSLAPPGQSASAQADLPAYVPEGYVPSLDSRLAIYQRLAGISSREQADAMLLELEDRFGAAPLPVLHLVDAAVGRLSAIRA